jgi:hypothetical protein
MARLQSVEPYNVFVNVSVQQNSSFIREQTVHVKCLEMSPCRVGETLVHILNHLEDVVVIIQNRETRIFIIILSFQFA